MLWDRRTKKLKREWIGVKEMSGIGVLLPTDIALLGEPFVERTKINLTRCQVQRSLSSHKNWGNTDDPKLELI